VISGSVLFSKSYSFGQKIRWLGLLAKTRRNQRMMRLAAAIMAKSDAAEPIIIDIGANVGLFTTAFMAAAKPPKLVLAIEPSNYVFTILKIVTTKLDRVRCRKLALSHESSQVQLKTPVKKSGSLRVGLSHIGNGDELTAFVENVQARRLDDLLTAEAITHVDIVKIDVEGAEQHVINGAPNLINKTKPIWFIELVQGRADNFTGSASDLFHQFISIGYQAFVLNDDYGWDQVTAISEATDYLFVPVATA
jgi:FkbM family methyltransferase